MNTKRRKHDKQISGTNIKIVNTTGVAGLRQMRCSACQGIAMEGRMPDGTSKFKCLQCGALFEVRKL